MLTPFDQTFEVPLAVSHPGKVFYVSDTGLAAFRNRKTPNDGNRGTFNDPFATIDYAIGQCVANRGDIIYVLPGHTETVTAAGGIACDVEGVAIIGLGTGTLRPTISFTTATAASVTVSADSVTLKNLLFSAAFADVAQAIDVTDTNCTIDSCEFVESGADLNFVELIHASSTTNNNADNLKVINCVGTGVDAALNSMLRVKADLDGLIFAYNFFVCDTTAALGIINVDTGKDLTDCLVLRNYSASVVTTGDLFINTDTGDNTGVVVQNCIGHADTAGAVLSTGSGANFRTGFRWFENLSASEDTTSGLLLPTADS